jgi:hypothetical protein
MPYQQQYNDDEVGSLFLWVVASHRLVWHGCFRTAFWSHLWGSRCPRRKTLDLHFGTAYSSHLQGSRCPRRKTLDLHSGTAYWPHLQSQLNMFKKKAFFLCFCPSTKGPLWCHRTLVANPPIPWNNPVYCRFWPTLQQKPGILHYKVTSLEFV